MYYTKEDLKAAIDAVNSGMTILDAAVKYAVPSRTLEHKVMQLVIAEADCRSDILTERRMTALRRYGKKILKHFSCLFCVILLITLIIVQYNNHCCKLYVSQTYRIML